MYNLASWRQFEASQRQADSCIFDKTSIDNIPNHISYIYIYHTYKHMHAYIMIYIWYNLETHRTGVIVTLWSLKHVHHCLSFSFNGTVFWLSRRNVPDHEPSKPLESWLAQLGGRRPTERDALKMRVRMHGSNLELVVTKSMLKTLHRKLRCCHQVP